jgi:4-hydroxybutyrate CoA-transferase
MERWQDRCGDKLVSVNEALRVIQPGHTVGIGLNANAPEFLCKTLGERASEWSDLRIVGGGAMHDVPFYTPEVAARHSIYDVFITVPTRQAMRQRAIDFVPINTARWPSDFVDGTRPLDVYLASVSPPDEHGYCSFGFMLWSSLELVEAAKVVIVEVDEDHIVTYGENFVHISQIDFLVEQPGETTLGDVASVMGYTAPSEVDRRIASHAASLIHDGDTLQIGAGTVSMAVIEHLHEKNDLGLHSEICPTGIAPLIAAGNINGAVKTLNPHKAICTALMGDAFTLDFAHRNPAIELRRMAYTNNPGVIAQHDYMVAVNNALSIDLTGQVAVESFGPQMYSGVGGQLEFTIGAMLAKHGRAITVVPSTARQGTVSRIVPYHPPGTVISVPRTYVNYVVTEYGAVDLLGKSQRERAERLISLAHPDFQTELYQAAQRLFWS